MRNKFYIIAIALLLGAVSCTSHKKTTTTTPPQTFEWLTANMDIQTEGDGMSANDLAGQLRMRKDSLIWLNVTATMGVEVARIKMSIDSVWVLNRMEKTYLVEPLDSLSVQLGIPLSLPLVQTLLLDNNEGFLPVENQSVLLKTFIMGNISAKVKYNNVKLDEKTAFPLKITDKMKRVRIKPRNGQ